MGHNMPIEIGGKPKERLDHKLYEKFISTSDIIGSIIYKDRKITKEEIIRKLFPPKTKQPKTARKAPRTINLRDLKSIFKKKPKTTPSPDVKRTVGSITLAGFILVLTLVILYIINFIFDLLLEIMEWWVLAILIMLFITPIGFMIGYYLAKDDY